MAHKKNRPPRRTLRSLIECQTEESLDSEALVLAGVRVAYLKFWDEAVSAGIFRMRALGARAGDWIAILMGSRSEWVAAALGAPTVGAADFPALARSYTVSSRTTFFERNGLVFVGAQA